jgi:predicted GIY-YIG superfamily endonuclease
MPNHSKRRQQGVEQPILRRSFRKLLNELEPKLLRLCNMKPAKPDALPTDMPKAGVYLFSCGDEHLYVGRTNRLRTRIQEHCRASASHDSAPFAFKLARYRSGFERASYTKQGSRQWLAKDPEFARVFRDCKKEIRDFDVRWVEEGRAKQQFLLELYVADALKAEHNDFDNH